MESVYKLSKYSQKISEACRTNQLNKVMEYNQHELAHINKLSKYFGNQKGGAEVGDVVGAVGELVQDVVADRNRVIDRLQQSVREKSRDIEQIDKVFEGEKAFKLSEAQSAPQPEVVLQKVQKLKQEKDRLTRENETLQGEMSAAQGSISRNDDALVRIQKALELKIQELEQAKQELAQARSQTSDLQQRLNTVSTQVDTYKTQLTVVKGNVEQKSAETISNLQSKLQAKDDRIAELEQAVADTQQLLEQSKARSEAILQPKL
jgi:DNA repair exonuclease SbcCD ATPase subunit